MQHEEDVSMRSRHQPDSGTDVEVVSAVWSLETKMCMRNSNTDVFHCADDPYGQLCQASGSSSEDLVCGS